MKRLHVSLTVAEDAMDKAVGFYATLFDAQPTVREPGYAKWMLDDPRVNFVLDASGKEKGVDHLGIQVETAEELSGVAARLNAAGNETLDQTGAHCCFARSDKSWVTDPQGILWETFLTHGQKTVYGEDRAPRADAGDTPACCAGE
jgi:catechol 2,3-dioxygenase-like lactoylglutathione lyase family enzyme